MKKVIFLLVVMLMVISITANATDVRLTSMGENYNVVRDDSNIWLYPSTILAYPDRIEGSITGNAMTKAGGNWQLGSFVVGAYFNAASYDMDFSSFGGMGFLSDVDQRIDVFFGSELADLGLGARISLWGKGLKRENSPQFFDNGSWDSFYENHLNFDFSASRFEFALGVTAMDGKADLSVQVGLNSWNLERNVYDPIAFNAATPDTNFHAYDDATSDGGMDFDINGRYFHEYNSKWTLVPHFSFSSGSNTAVSNDWYGIDADGDFVDDSYAPYEDGRSEVSATSFAIGVGTNFQPSENVMTVTDLGIRFSKSSEEIFNYSAPDYDSGGETGTQTWSYKDEVSPSYMPYFKLGLDAAVRPWLDLRIGAVSRWYSTEITDESNTTRVSGSVTESGVSATTYLGAGFQWGDLTIDTILQPGFLSNGPNFITGNTTNGWASRVAVRYMFGAE